MPTEAGIGNGAEVHFLPTTSAFLFNSAEAASGGVHDGNEGLGAAFIRWRGLVREHSPARWSRAVIGRTENVTTVL